MRFKEYSGTEQFRPLSAWAYFGYGILFMIPVIGWILLIVFSFNTRNYNRRSFARSYWCGLILTILIAAVLLVTGVGFGWLYENIPALQQYLPEQETTSFRTQQYGHTTPEETSDKQITVSFKQAMDEYEAFIDEYIDFMESFDAVNSTTEQLSKYAAMMNQYGETMESLDQIEDTDLSDSDSRYYVEVMLRINQKLNKFIATQK